MSSLPLQDESSVFLNVPFDPQYRPLFVALIAGLTALGRTPRSVLEITGRDRLDHLYDLLTSCPASVHDLSRVSLCGPARVPRFNMPFELGLAYALSRSGAHRFFVLEEKRFRLQASLSDLNGHDPQIHDGTQAGILSCVLDCFGGTVRAPSPRLMAVTTRKLSQVVARLQREHNRDHPFFPHLFRQTVDAALELANWEPLEPS